MLEAAWDWVWGRERETNDWFTPASAFCLNKCGEGMNSPFGVRDGARRRGHTRDGCRATNSRGPLDYVVALHYRGTTNQSGAPWIRRKGFLRRAGFLQLLTQNRRVNTVTQYLHQVALTVRQSQLRPAGLLHLSQASGQSCPCSWPWEDLSCGFNLQKTEIMIKGCYLALLIWSLFTSSSSTWLKRTLL